MFFLEKIKRFIKNNWVFAVVVIFYVLTSAAPLFWYRKISYLYQFIGRGDFLSPININKLITGDFFTLAFQSAGVDNSSNFAHFIPANFFYYILYRLNINSIQSALLLISFIIFVSQASFYCLITYFNQKYGNVSIQARLTAIISGVLYGYSPFVLALIAPGHVYLLFNYAVFPLIIKYLDILIDAQNIRIKDLFCLFIFFLFSAASYANAGIILVNVIVIGLYFFSKIIAEKKSLLQIILKLSIAYFLIFLSNSWWLFAYIYTIISNGLLSVATSPETLRMNILNTSTDSFLYSILFGKVMFNYVISNKDNVFNVLNIFSMLFLWCFFFVKTVKKELNNSKYLGIFLLLVIIIIFLLKGGSNPFSSVYNYFYFHIPGFVSLRNSVNKFYWLFWFSLLTVSSISISEILNKKGSKKILNFLLIAVFTFISLFYMFVFIKTPQFSIFNIPDYYKKINEHLISKKNTNKVLLLPPIQGGYAPFFGSDSNYYHGINYIPEIIDFPIITDGSLNTQTDILAGKVYFNILHNMPICDYLKKLNIGDVIVLKDINEKAVSINNLNPMILNMKKMNEFSRYQLYGETNQNGVYLFEVNKSCSGSLINLEGDEKSSAKYNVINPVTVQVDIKNLQNAATLQFLINSNSNWIAKMQRYDNKEINKFDLLFNSYSLNTKQPKPLYNYANSWSIDKDNIVTSFDQNFYKRNPDGSIDIKLILYYKVQNYLYFGLIFFLVFSILGACSFLKFGKLKK